jgi:SAM-dependent methyltransferase
VNLEDAHCVVCGHRGPSPIYDVVAVEESSDRRTFQISQCAHCELVGVQPRLTAEEIVGYYSEAYYAKDKLRLKSILEDDLPGLRRADRLKKWCKGGAVLDVGCGSGKFLSTLDSDRWRKVGIELSDTAANLARQQYGIEVFVGDLQEAHYPDHSFDLITLWHVFEHLPDPMPTLRELRRILKDDGILLVAVPNFGSLERRLAQGHWYHLDVPRHYFHYTPKTLGHMLDQAGFRVVKVRHFILKNWYGFLQSALNALGLGRNLVRDWLGGRLGQRRITWRQRAQIGVTLLLLPFVAVTTATGTLLESGLGMGGTIEVYATAAKPRG